MVLERVELGLLSAGGHRSNWQSHGTAKQRLQLVCVNPVKLLEILQAFDTIYHQNFFDKLPFYGLYLTRGF